jgi:hypothetical protein
MSNSTPIDFSDSVLSGKRLERVRRMTGLDRTDLYAKYGISAGTLRSWESARHPGLTEKGARKMLKVFEAEGIQCSLAWLLDGTGHPPSVLEQSFIKDGLIPHRNNTQIEEAETIAFTQELAVFHKHHPHGIDLQIPDDSMAPIYLTGDYVAGERQFHDAIRSVIGQTCIVETQMGKILLRSLREGTKKDHYTLQCLNLSSTHGTPTLYDVELVSAAPVVWHRKVF